MKNALSGLKFLSTRQLVYFLLHVSGHSAASHQNSQFLLNRRPYFSTIKPSNNSGLLPSTPLVKQKTSGCASPRVQMYRTRVVYSDARDAVNIKAQEAAV